MAKLQESASFLHFFRADFARQPKPFRYFFTAISCAEATEGLEDSSGGLECGITAFLIGVSRVANSARVVVA